MKSISILLAFTLMLLSACSGSESEPQSQTNNNQTQTDPVVETETNNTPEELTEEGTPTNSDGNSTVSGLIPSTNPQERLNQVSQGKSDPFNSITPPAVIKVDSPNSISGTNSGSVGNVASIRNNPTVNSPSTSRSDNQIAALDRNNTSNNQGIPGEPTPTTNGLQNPNIGNVPQIPQLPTPLEAEQINVTGILDIQGQTVALVQTPWDGTTRSVRVGDIISDNTGSVNIRVRNISFGFPTNAAFPDVNQVTFRDISSSEGMVMLEQNGRTVTREVAQQDSETQL